MKLSWMDQLKIDGGAVDRQHYELFELYNAAEVLPENDENKAVLLGQLRDYAVRHFAEEESLMETSGCPPEFVAHHRAQHRSFEAALGTLADQPMYQLLDFVREWLLVHIITEDRKIHRFVQNQVGPPRSEG